MRRRGFLCLIAVVLGWIAPAQITPSASGPDRWVFGVYAGWSRGLGWEFDWHYRSSISDRTSLQLHFGAYARYEISRSLGVQLDLNYQSGLNEWTFSYWNWPKTSGDDRFGITALSLQGVVHVCQIKRLRAYLQGGGGLSAGSWGEYGGFSGAYYHLLAGAGIKIGISAQGSYPALNLGGSLLHLINPLYGVVRTADYVRLQVGFEF
jgi:hypothetical protein